MSDPEQLNSLRRQFAALLDLKLRHRDAVATQVVLKQAIHAERDHMQQTSALESDLQAQLRQEEQNESALDAALAVGAPDWSGSSSEWGGWLAGTEVLYTAKSPAADSAGSAEARMEVVQAEQPVRMQVYTRPFAMGGLRAAYYARLAPCPCPLLPAPAPVPVPAIPSTALAQAVPAGVAPTQLTPNTQPPAMCRLQGHRRQAVRAEAGTGGAAQAGETGGGHACRRHAAAICGAVAEAFCRPEHKLPATLSFLKGEPGTCSAGSRCVSWQPARLRCAIVQPSGLIHWLSTCLCFGSSWHAASVVLLEDSSQPGGKLVYLKEPFIDSHGGNSGSGTGGSNCGSSAGSSSSVSGGSSAATWIKWTRNDGHVFPGK